MDSVRDYQSIYHKGGTTGVLLLHGFTGTPYIFRDLSKAFRRIGLTVSAPLLDGHGTTPEHLEKTTWKSWIRSAAEAYDELSEVCPGGVFVLGASFGGNLACWLAANRPVKGLILIGIPRWIYKQGLILFGTWFYPLIGVRFFRKNLHFLDIRHLMNGRLSDNSIIGGPNRSYAKIPISSVRQFFELVDRTGAPLLRRVKTPALVIQSTNDGLVKASSGSYVFKHLGSESKELVFISAPHHELHLNETVKRDIFQEVKAFVVRWE